MVKITFDTSTIAPPLPVENLVFTVTENAATRLNHIFSKKPESSFLRIEVLGGGCNGYSYNFKVEDAQNKTDFAFTHTSNPAAKVCLNEASLRLLHECTLDFVETAEANQFVINNPHAKSSCGCGNSFGY